MPHQPRAVPREPKTAPRASQNRAEGRSLEILCCRGCLRTMRRHARKRRPHDLGNQGLCRVLAKALHVRCPTTSLSIAQIRRSSCVYAENCAMTTFLLIRHGHTDWVGNALAGRLPGIGLSTSGRVQAQDLLKRLSRLKIDAVYSSPLQRTVETATPLATERGLEVRTREGLIELDFGQWTGMKLSEVEDDPQWKQFNALRSITRA